MRPHKHARTQQAHTHTYIYTHRPILWANGGHDFFVDEEMFRDKRVNVVSGIRELPSPRQLHQQQKRTPQSHREVRQSTARSTIGLHRFLIGQTTLAGKLAGPHQAVAQDDPLEKLPVIPARFT